MSEETSGSRRGELRGGATPWTPFWLGFGTSTVLAVLSLLLIVAAGLGAPR